MYFDYNSTHPLLEEVKQQIGDSLQYFGNPSSPHFEGRKTRDLIEQSREVLASYLGVEHRELYFTSGGTEANHLALLGYMNGSANKGDLVVSSQIEHPSVHGALDLLSKQGYEVFKHKVNRDGALDLELLENKLAGARLASFMVVNNETGTVFPLEQISEICAAHGVVLHSDWVQGFGKLNLHSSGLQMASLSGHKIGALKGVGALYVKKGFKLNPLFVGGSQEKKLRVGTENLLGIISIKAAVEVLQKQKHDCQILGLRDYFEDSIKNIMPEAKINGQDNQRVGNTSSVTFPGISAETMMFQLDLNKVCVSMGSACSSGASTPSPVLTAMGLNKKEAQSTIRFSFGRYNDQEQVERLLGLVKVIIEKQQSKKRGKR